MKLTDVMARAAAGETLDGIVGDWELPASLRKKIRAEAAAGAREAVIPLLVLFWILNRRS